MVGAWYTLSNFSRNSFCGRDVWCTRDLEVSACVKSREMGYRRVDILNGRGKKFRSREFGCETKLPWNRVEWSTLRRNFMSVTHLNFHFPLLMVRIRWEERLSRTAPFPLFHLRPKKIVHCYRPRASSMKFRTDSWAVTSLPEPFSFVYFVYRHHLVRDVANQIYIYVTVSFCQIQDGVRELYEYIIISPAEIAHRCSLSQRILRFQCIFNETHTF